MPSYHKLLNRQIKKYLSFPIDSTLEPLLQAISESYEHYETDRVLLERAMDLSSEELFEINNKLQNEAKNKQKAINKIQESVIALKAIWKFEEQPISKPESLLTVADYLKKLVSKINLIEERLQKSRSNLSALIENSKDAIWSIDSDFQLLTFNTIFQKRFRYLYKTTVKEGFDLRKIVPKKHQGNWEAWYETALAGKRFSIEKSYLIEKEKRYFEISFNPIFSKERILGVSIFSRDITKRKTNENLLKKSHEELELRVIERTTELLDEVKKHIVTEQKLLLAKEKAEESDKLKSAFLANMSHEIRTPLNAILGFSDLLLQEDIDADSKKKFVQYIQKSGESLTNLINDIIDISKIEAGQLKIEKENFFAKQFLTEIFESFSESESSPLEDKEIDFRLDIENVEDVNFFTDRLRIRQIIVNFVHNALKFTEKGSVKLGYTIINDNQQAEIEFFVKDTGLGIEKNKIDIIFGRFQKIEENKKKLYRGTGLGLAISKNLSVLLGGKIRVESDFGKGSSFYLKLPYKTNKIAKKKKEILRLPSLEVNLNGIEILIAEDEMLNFFFLKEIFRNSGAAIFHAKNGREAITIFKENPTIEIVLMDIKMPVLDGCSAAKELKKMNSSVLIIAQSAYAMTGEKEKILTENCDEYIPKPLNINKLWKILKKYF